MKNLLIAISAFVICCGFSAAVFLQPSAYDPQTSVSSVLLSLGEKAPAHYRGTENAEEVSKGKSLVLLGGPYSSGAVESRLSQHFVCVDCHNIVPESKFADDNEPNSRLRYAKEFNQPYLPGSTLYGITNRTSWFNGDHEKKYGKELIDPARHDLINAIQLCSKECSVGRTLTPEEMESVLQFLNGIDLKMKDLNLSNDELAQISATAQTPEQKAENIKLIRSKFVQGFPATFEEAIPVSDRKLGTGGTVENGKYIYEKSCLHCHSSQKTVTDRTVFGSDEGQKGFKWLASYFKKNNGGSIYWITRHGTASKENIPQYMPIYSKEKLGDSQVEDLAAYILSESKK